MFAHWRWWNEAEFLIFKLVAKSRSFQPFCYMDMCTCLVAHSLILSERKKNAYLFDSTVQLASELHALTLVARSYALLQALKRSLGTRLQYYMAL